MDILRIVALIFFLASSSSLFAQPYFQRNDDVPVTVNGEVLKFPWAGGLNHPQVSNIDLNNDGTNDLFVFDKSGNKILTFIQSGSVGTMDLEYAPEYRKMFINQHSEFRGLHDWVLLNDFNCDNKADIFTYSNGGMAVYRNDTQGDSLVFTLLIDELQSLQNGDMHNVYNSPVDLPAIADFDGDGDMDIVTFSFSGLSANLHKSMSVETYGHCDSINFVLDDPCWGQFEEDPSTLNVTLNATCKGGTNLQPSSSAAAAAAHSGFTLTPIDIESDGDMDMIISNVTFDNMNLLTNGGSILSAQITAQDPTFPANFSSTEEVDIYTFPAAFNADVNNDGKEEIIVSGYQENNGENYNGVWLYENVSTGPAQEFVKQQEDFLQDEMIELGSGAYPAIIDIDGDGLKDLLVGNFGYFVSTGIYDCRMAYYRNTGTANAPAFTMMADDYLTLSNLNLLNIAPTIGDLDDDGDEDMIIGEATGIVHYYRNDGGAGNPVQFVLAEPGYQGIDVQGQYATPNLFDLDGDDDLDLVIGERNGNLNYFENQGTAAAANFVLVDDAFGSVNTNAPLFSFGYSAPFVFEYEDELKMYVGSESGDIHVKNQIEDILAAPPLVTAAVGTNDQTSTGYAETPFGFEKRSGRNQMLIRADELEAAGFLAGQIQKISFTTLSGIETPTGSLRIKLKNTELNSLSELLPPPELETAFTSQGIFYSPGLLEFDLFSAFNWDGTSNLLIEVCYAHAFSSAQNMDIALTNTGFNSNAYGSSNSTADGCNTSPEGVSQLRPVMTITMKPGFGSQGELALYEGERIALDGDDLDGDGLMDLIIGNLAGGLNYYSGDTAGVGPNSIKIPTKSFNFNVYPNPASNQLTIEFSGQLPANYNVVIVDMMGRQVSSVSGDRSGRQVVDVRDLPAGVYSVSIVSRSGIQAKRFIKSDG